MRVTGFDVCVSGSGAVAMSLALALSAEGWSVAWARAPESAKPQQADVRTYALNARAIKLLERLRVWPALKEWSAPVSEMDVRGDEGGALSFSAWQQCVTELAWIVDAAALERLLGEAAAPNPSLAPEITARFFEIPLREAREAFERIYFEQLLGKEQSNMSKVAEKAGLAPAAPTYHFPRLELLLAAAHEQTRVLNAANEEAARVADLVIAALMLSAKRRGDRLAAAAGHPGRRIELARQQLAERRHQCDARIQERLPLHHHGPAQRQWRRILRSCPGRQSVGRLRGRPAWRDGRTRHRRLAAPRRAPLLHPARRGSRAGRWASSTWSR